MRRSGPSVANLTRLRQELGRADHGVAAIAVASSGSPQQADSRPTLTREPTDPLGRDRVARLPSEWRRTMAETTERTWTETLSAQGEDLLAQVQQLVHEGNVRRIVIKHGATTVADFPLNVGVAGALIAPRLAVVGAIAALIGDAMLDDWSVAVERSGAEPAPASPDGMAAP